MKQIDHIGIAVNNMEASIARYEILLNTPCYKRETVESQGVETAFFKVGDSKIELIAATSPQSVIVSFIEKRGEGIHHIAFETDDLRKEAARMQNEGFRLLNEHPQPGADNKEILFLHPKDTGGVLVELCQTKPVQNSS